MLDFNIFIMKTYILGMAKSTLQVSKGQYNGIADAYSKSPNPGPLRNLELDFLRLVYATKELLVKGHKVISYLMVATPEIEVKVIKWKEKYEVENDIVNIICASLNKNEIMQLIEEKTKNKNANTPDSINKEVNARADKSKGILEEKLKIFIEQKHENGKVIQERMKMPFQIYWDYCAVKED